MDTIADSTWYWNYQKLNQYCIELFLEKILQLYFQFISENLFFIIYLFFLIEISALVKKIKFVQV